jgi:flagellar hook-associated protein 3 FlgL
MAGIIPIPTTRVGDYFVRQRLTTQVQLDQLDLFKLQNQVSTGRRLQLPSEDAPAALRAINLQRLLDRKGQIRTNVQSSAFYLGAADTSLGEASSELIKIRGEAVSVAGTLTNDEARRKLIEGIDATIQLLVNTGNTNSQGRYVFAGSSAQVQPYEFNGAFIEYLGNEGSLRSYVDLERLFDTNLAGTDVLGGISSEVQGSNLNAQLTTDTLVGSINGGQGLSRNAALSVTINTGATTLTSVIDLGTAVTIGDIARLIKDGAPAGSQIVVDVTNAGLRLSSPSGQIGVSEVAQGHTARELGLTAGPPQSSTLIGTALNPAILKTTQLSELIGARAQGRIAGANDDILLRANANGDELNNVRIIYMGDASVGAETVTYDDSNPLDKTLTVHIQPNFSTLQQVTAAITAHGLFTAVLEPHKGVSASLSGSETVVAGDLGQLTSGGVDGILDTGSGLILNNGIKSLTLDTSGAETVEDLLNLINSEDLGLLAEINLERNGINIRSRLSGADMTIGENGGTLATQLGVRTYTGATNLSAFNRGIGVPTSATGADLHIIARDLTEFDVDLGGAATVDDVINSINAAAAAANSGAGVNVVARLATTGNGIEIVDTSAIAGTTTVAAVEGSQAARFLGFVAGEQTQNSSATGIVQSEDRHTLEADSVFNTLIRLKRALEQSDEIEIGRSLERLDNDLNRVNFARAEIGARIQNLEVIDTRLEDENVQLQSALAQDMDVDLVEAISNLTARQFAFEASLRTSASILQLSLLNFI